MDKVLKTQIKGYVKLKLATDPVWAQKALLKIYELQTQDEKKSQHTIYYNNIGFTGTDSRILTSLSKYLQKFGCLTQKQMNIVFKKMPKYWNQIVKMSDQEKLYSLVK